MLIYAKKIHDNTEDELRIKVFLSSDGRPVMDTSLIVRGEERYVRFGVNFEEIPAAIIQLQDLYLLYSHSEEILKLESIILPSGWELKNKKL